MEPRAMEPRGKIPIVEALLAAACLLSPPAAAAQESARALGPGSAGLVAAAAAPDREALPAPVGGAEAREAGVGRLPLPAIPVEELRARREERSGVLGSIVRLRERVFGSRGFLRWGEFEDGDGYRLRVGLQADDPGVRFVLVTS